MRAGVFHIGAVAVVCGIEISASFRFPRRMHFSLRGAAAGPDGRGRGREMGRKELCIAGRAARHPLVAKRPVALETARARVQENGFAGEKQGAAQRPFCRAPNRKEGKTKRSGRREGWLVAAGRKDGTGGMDGGGGGVALGPNAEPNEPCTNIGMLVAAGRGR